MNPKPTRRRYLVIAAAFLMAVLLYLDRFCVGIAEPYIRQDLGLTKQQMGIFLSAFFWTYALGQVPAGWMSDRYGARSMLTIYILTWSVFTALMGLAGGFVMLLITRAAYGLGQSGAYPTSSTIISRWIPLEGRGGASAIVSGGGRIGAVLAPIITTVLIVALVPSDAKMTFNSDSVIDLPSIHNTLWPEEFTEQPVHANYLAERLQKVRRTNSADDFIAELNQQITSQDFYSAESFARLKSLNKTAAAIIKRIDAGDDVSEKDVHKLNRFLVEAILPSQLKGLYVKSWRPVLWIYGALGIFVAGFFWFVARDNPSEHPGVNELELTKIHGDAGNNPKQAEALPMMAILQNRSLWASSAMQICVNIGWLFVGTWFATYLLEEYQTPIHERGLMAMTPFIVAWFGSISGGVFTDRLARRIGVRWGRRLPLMLGIGLSASAFCVCPFLDNPWAVTAMMAAMAFGVDFAVPSMWAFNQDIGGDFAGSILGWGNMWGNLGAAASPPLLVYISETYDWNTMFYVCGAVMAVGSALCLLMDAEEKVIATPPVTE
ncbi:MAG: MFS transporter [Pirellulales bacterium]|nr:MFS transporter [Pirellulales bacterium]